jgi:hypothetical protein
MPSVTSIISAICPSLAASPAQSTFVALAMEETSSEYWGGGYTMAVALLACHLFTLAQRSYGAVGPVTGMSEGRLSLQFAASGGSGGDLMQTHYGRQLRARMPGAASVTGYDPNVLRDFYG